MKNILMLIMIALAVGCGEPVHVDSKEYLESQTYYYKYGSGWNASATVLTLKGHEYIRFENTSGSSIQVIHAEHCKCRRLNE